MTDYNDRNNFRSTDNSLYRLNELDDYKVADHSADIRGWEVNSRDGHAIGRVKDLVVDKTAQKVRYIDLELDEEYHVDSDNTEMHLLVPVGAARLDEDDDKVYVDRIMTADELYQYPRTLGSAISRDYEQEVVNYHAGAITSTDNYPDDAVGNAGDPIVAYDKNEDSFYKQDCFREDLLSQKRRTR